MFYSNKVCVLVILQLLFFKIFLFKQSASSNFYYPIFRYILKHFRPEKELLRANGDLVVYWILGQIANKEEISTGFFVTQITNAIQNETRNGSTCSLSSLDLDGACTDFRCSSLKAQINPGSSPAVLTAL